jgi:hypothetical protein
VQDLGFPGGLSEGSFELNDFPASNRLDFFSPLFLSRKKWNLDHPGPGKKEKPALPGQILNTYLTYL